MEEKNKYSVIIADDEPGILSGLSNSYVWRSLGIKVVALARNGEEAIGMIRSHKPTFAILDIKMPKLSGIEVLKKIKEEKLQTEVLILSGYDEFTYAKNAIRYGAKAYLLKPLDRRELEDELTRLIDAREIGLKSDSEVFPLPPRIFFNSLIDGKILSPDQIQATLSNSMISISNSPCFVVVFDFENPENVNFEQLVPELNSCFLETKHKIWNYNSHTIMAIFNVSMITPIQIAAECMQIISHMKISPLPYVGVGDVVDSLIKCSYSYNRAITALSYRIYSPTLRVFSSDMITNRPPEFKSEDIDCTDLVDSIVGCMNRDMEKQVRQFISRLFYVKYPPPNYFFSMCFELYRSVLERLRPLDLDERSMKQDIQNFSQFKSSQEIEEWLIESFSNLSDIIRLRYGSGNAAWILKDKENEENEEDKSIRIAKKYIHDNIRTQIRLEDIAAKVNLSASYFAIYFKSKTGMNIRDYILMEKMGYAKKRLMNEEASISDIAYEIGYGDYRSFSRAFKNIYGMTPSMFQEERKKGR